MNVPNQEVSPKHLNTSPVSKLWVFVHIFHILQHPHRFHGVKKVISRMKSWWENFKHECVKLRTAEMQTGFTMPEVLVSAGLGIVLTTATAATVAGAVGVMASVEKSVIRGVLPTSVANKITEQVSSADILVPVNAMTNGTFGASLYYNTELAFFSSPVEGVCEYHNYFLSQPKNVNPEDKYVASLNHFVKQFNIDLSKNNESYAVFSCMQYYNILNTKATERRSALLATEAVDGNYCKAFKSQLLPGESCKVLLPKVYAEEPVFYYSRNDARTLPQIKNGTELKNELPPASLPLGVNLPSFGVFRVSTTSAEICTLDGSLNKRDGEGQILGPQANAPGADLAMVKIALTLPDTSGGSTSWSKEIYERYATPKYVTIGGRAC